MYIQSATIDGRPLRIPVITWEQLRSGAHLRFVMGPQPSQWGSQWRPSPIAAQPLPSVAAP